MLRDGCCEKDVCLQAVEHARQQRKGPADFISAGPSLLFDRRLRGLHYFFLVAFLVAFFTAFLAAFLTAFFFVAITNDSPFKQICTALFLL